MCAMYQFTKDPATFCLDHPSVVNRGQEIPHSGLARSMSAQHIAQSSKSKWFIEDNPMFDFTTIFFCAYCRKTCKPFHQKMTSPPPSFSRAIGRSQ